MQSGFPLYLLMHLYLVWQRILEMRHERYQLGAVRERREYVGNKAEEAEAEEGHK